MGTNLIMFLIAIVALVIGAGGSWFIAQKGKDPKGLLGTADTVIDEVKTANDTFGKLLPAPLEFIIDNILKATQAGVHGAQQLANSNQITEDQRKEQAFTTAINMLKVAGYIPTPDLMQAVRDTIQTGVFIMKNTTANSPMSAVIKGDSGEAQAASGASEGGPDVKMADPASSSTATQTTVQQAIDQGIRQVLQPVAQQTADQTVKSIVDEAVQSGVKQLQPTA